MSDLVTATRMSVVLTVLILIVHTVYLLRGKSAAERRDALPFGRALIIWAALTALPATILSFAAPPELGRAFLAVGIVLGILLGVATNFYPPARRAFDRLADGEVRTLLGYRATFGALLLAAAALGVLPPAFALAAGLGDLAVTWLAHLAPRSLAANGGRAWRVLVHGWGLLDGLQVVVLAVLVVRPWLAENAGGGPPLLLPWVAVPLMICLNLHGLRSAIAESRAVIGRGPARASEPDRGRDPVAPGRDGSESPRGLRGAVG